MEQITGPLGRRIGRTNARDVGGIDCPAVLCGAAYAIGSPVTLTATPTGAAVFTGWTVASDEKGRFRREAQDRLGSDRVIGTADLFILAIRCRLLTIEEADADKLTLEVRRFTMPFQSFGELLSE